jgi:hypothetical protein
MMLSPAGTILSVSAATDANNNDVVFAITADTNLWEHSLALPGNGWRILSTGSFQSVSAGRNGAGSAFQSARPGIPHFGPVPGLVVFGVLSDNSLWECNPGYYVLWQNLSPAGTILAATAAGRDEVFAITADHNLWHHSLAGWALVSTGTFASVSGSMNAGGLGEVFGVLTDSSLWEYNPAFGGSHWRALNAPGVLASAAPQRR